MEANMNILNINKERITKLFQDIDEAFLLNGVNEEGERMVISTLYAIEKQGYCMLECAKGYFMMRNMQRGLR